MAKTKGKTLEEKEKEKKEQAIERRNKARLKKEEKNIENLVYEFFKFPYSPCSKYLIQISDDRYTSSKKALNISVYENLDYQKTGGAERNVDHVRLVGGGRAITPLYASGDRNNLTTYDIIAKTMEIIKKAEGKED
ncbi:MAG: hypothetical protein KJ767_01540 [Nanoarchaeota archaeon]|nr:hypothetical protein [Nanoarchaeota archaeon]